MKKTSFAKVAGGLALLALSSVAMASVVNTKHNLGATGGIAGPSGTDGNHTNNTTEICIFCHTPHGGDQSAFAPIWNRALGTGNTNGAASGTSGTTYQRFSSLGRLTFDAKEAPIGSVSAACLSCHDGTQAMDAVINSPGSDSTGNVSSDASKPAPIAGVGTSNGWSQGQAMGDGSFTGANNSWDGNISTGGGTRGDMVYLGTDLRNDHPISMQYGGGGMFAGAGNTDHVTNDPDFAQSPANSMAGAGATGSPGGLWDSVNGVPIALASAPKSNAASTNTTGGVRGSGTGLILHDMKGAGGTDRWWVDTSGTVAATATYNSGDFPLYSRTDVVASGASGALEPTVECGTCHDPHSGNPTFLRVKGGNAGSQVCLTCHAK